MIYFCIAWAFKRWLWMKLWVRQRRVEEVARCAVWTRWGGVGWGGVSGLEHHNIFASMLWNCDGCLGEGKISIRRKNNESLYTLPSNLQLIFIEGYSTYSLLVVIHNFFKLIWKFIYHLISFNYLLFKHDRVFVKFILSFGDMCPIIVFNYCVRPI